MLNYNLYEIYYKLSSKIKMNRMRYSYASPKGWLSNANSLFYE